jgi:hypothetical protein
VDEEGKEDDRELSNDDVLSLASELSAKLNEGFCMVKVRLDKSDKENKGLRSKLVDRK